MSQQNNYPSKWPKAFVAIAGVLAISGAAYVLKEPNIFWALIPLIWLVDSF
jgi:hypothetical protein